MLNLSPQLNPWRGPRRDQSGTAATARTVSGPSLTLDFADGHYMALQYRDRLTPSMYLLFTAGSYGQRTITA